MFVHSATTSLSQPAVFSAGVTYSAQGTRLNRRGVESRQRFLRTAIELLAETGSESLSPNLIARRAGFTWGTIQHQFGDADGVWAAILESLLERMQHFSRLQSPPEASVRRRITFIVETMWKSLDSIEARAVQHIRHELPRDSAALSATYPKTEAIIRQWDVEWNAAWDRLLDGLPVSPAKLRRVRNLVPSALRGLHDTPQEPMGFTDVDDARRGLVDALIAYLK
jgi:AcrR family transcriptional regulator